MKVCNDHLAAAAALHEAGNFLGALAVYDQARVVCGDRAEYWNNRGNTLLELNRLDDAMESYRAALSRCPSLGDTRIALATCLQGTGRTDEALAECNAVLALYPDHAEAHWNRSLLLLLTGRYEEGWDEYEWRWRKRRFTSPLREFGVPQWGGERLSGRRILIHAEQGFGDTIQFCRYLPLVAGQGAEVVFECHQPLVNLMKSLPGNIQVIPFGTLLPSVDLHCPLLSLPRIFGTTPATIPALIPYLSPPPRHLLFWEDLLAAQDGLKIGLCWKGKPYPDPGRSCPAELLAPLGTVPGVTFYSLQVEHEQNRFPFSCNGFAPLLLDFSDSAALVAQLDLVITIDTAVAHLAGALGRNTWAMLPYAPDWRWGLQGDSTPWYPKMRLFRQREANGWEDLVKSVADVLAAWVVGLG